MLTKQDPLIFIDIETTGLDVTIHEIIEIAVIKVEQINLNILETYVTKILPYKIEIAQPEALKINKYNKEIWNMEAISLFEALLKIIDFSQNGIFINHNIQFDLSFLCRDFYKHSLKMTGGYHSIDTSSLISWPLFIGNKIKGLGLTELCNYYNVSNDGAHSALIDVMRVYNIYKKFIQNI